ncbi:aldehyde dehydrogenase [Novosphingobium colocasiae]|uniref:aldehyde dehydrogenase family protein n=1 Tax=Novosphingobium colocasiae TaxID=1256513 RepID=UPI0035B0C376
MNTSAAPLPSFLVDPDKMHFIDGAWLASASGQTIETRNPATGEVIARLARGGQEEIDLAVAAARRAFEGRWSRITPSQRHGLLMRAHAIMELHGDELALLETYDMGAPVSRGLGIRSFILKMIEYFAAQAMNWGGETIPNSLPGQFTTMTIKAPVGVIGGIIPWNSPMVGAWWTIGGALATGCTVVLKPAEDASLSVLRLAELLAEAGIPDGVVNVVTGLGAEAGAALAVHADVDRIAFTGSTVTGREVIRASASNIKRLSLELGGKSPDIVFADADLAKAVPGAAMGVFNNSGQICYAGTRVFVQRSIQEEFVERMAAFTSTLKVGSPLDPDVQLGPLISERQLSRVLEYIEIGSFEGASLAVGGKRLTGNLAGGYFVEPTVFDNVDNGMRVAQEEIFGPVMSVIPFDDGEEALRLANSIEYGLGGAVWTDSVSTATRMMHGIKAGQVWVNCYGQMDPAVGFGGCKLSGYGWKGGSEHLEGFLYKKAVTISAN